MPAILQDRGSGRPVLDYRPAPTVLPPAAARPVLGWLAALLPPLVAIVSWPVLYVIFFLMSFTLALMVVVACLIWAWRVSGTLAAWRYWRKVQAVLDGAAPYPSAVYRARVRAILFALQAVAILASCPLFGLVLRLAQRRGIRLGWW